MAAPFYPLALSPERRDPDDIEVGQSGQGLWNVDGGGRGVSG